MGRMERTCSLVVSAVIAAGLAAVPSTASAHTRPSIVGGRPATGNWAGSLALVVGERAGGEVQECTGTVVAPRLVLTAAHCLFAGDGVKLDPSHVSVFTRRNASRGVRVYRSRVSRTVPDPSYASNSFGDDAGLLVLQNRTAATPLSLDTPAAAAKLTQMGAERVIAGWGDRRPEQVLAQRVPIQAATVVQAAEVCSLDAADDLALAFVPRLELCTVSPVGTSTGACHGDSGGPLLASGAGRVIEVAVISHGDGDCSPRVPTYFTRASVIGPWVGSWISRLRR